MGKKELQSIFSSNPEKYYKVSLFDVEGFKRYSCSLCDKFFWSTYEKTVCPDHENYGFIGNPPTTKRFDYVETWKVISDYFRSKNHHVIGRYPVVCRWREDLYFTIASIVDFQRIVGNNVVFELPYNPLLVPQMCLRFNDIENVGLSGRHYTSFCMIGQTCNADSPGGYWKDRCIELDYNMLTSILGIPKEEITFVEDVWIGAGAFGYSLEYFVRGLELGNAVFTEFEGNENQYRVMPNRIIDMGAGLERLSWITNGTPTSYDCCFGPVVKNLVNLTFTNTDPDILSEYFIQVSSKIDSFDDFKKLKSHISSTMGIEENKLLGAVSAHEAIYTIADHTRTLLFSISDGALPSNVGGGYNLRVLLRRILSIIERYGWTIGLDDICDMHINYLKQIFPELEEHREDVRTILNIESLRYKESKKRMIGIAQSIKKKTADRLSINDLIRLYESDGVTPDLLVEAGVLSSIPSLFYTKLAELHVQTKPSSAQLSLPGLDNVSPTTLLYYKDMLLRKFEARVENVLNGKYVILDRTAFYPRGGGQESDKGIIKDIRVIEVLKQGDVVIHVMEKKCNFIRGEYVNAIVDDDRRNKITRHHTATHILNVSSRSVLGPWVWQNSAYKEESYGRLDITHHSSLNKEELDAIEQKANAIVRKDVPVLINQYDRNDAEQRYSFRIYQGGVVPSSNVRIVNIENYDIEACGGTHVIRTGELGLIKILKSERIQDGVVRFEFVAGEPALNYVQNQEHQINLMSSSLATSKDKVIDSLKKTIEDAEASKKKINAIMRRVSDSIAERIILDAKVISQNGLKLYCICDDELDSDYYIYIGEKVTKLDPYLVFVGLLLQNSRIHVLVFSGEKAIGLNLFAKKIAQNISTILGGSGGGTNHFGQGGGKNKDKIKEALFAIEESLRKEKVD